MPNRHRRSLSEEERAERRRQERERFERAVRELLTSEGWARWVTARSTFHRYSLRNTILIAQQRPDATYVAGFRGWLRLNRCVRKGEKAIRIFAPCPVKARDQHGTELVDEHGRPQTRTYFKLTSVFDVAQTDPLPDRESVPLEPPREPLAGDSHAHLFERVEALCAELGYRVERRGLSCASAGGWCNRGERLIVVGEDEPNAELRTLVHEAAHALVGERAERFAYDVEEVVVDTATYVACQTVGLDVGGESIPYVAGWGESGALEAVQSAAAVVDEVARTLEQALAVEPADEGAQAA